MGHRWKPSQGVVPILAVAATACGRTDPPRSTTLGPGSAQTTVAAPSATQGQPTTQPAPPARAPGLETFRCKALPSVRFQFPVFPQWEPKRTVEKADGCIVFLDWPDTVEFELAPQLRVSRIPDYDAKSVPAHAPGTEFSIGPVQCFDSQLNPQGVLMSRAFDTTRWTRGYQRQPGQWDYLQFYGKTLAVRLRLDAGGEEYGFSRKAFRERVVQSFRFAE